MSARHFPILAILASFCFGYGLQESKLQSADPAACSKYKCKTIYAVWAANAVSVVVHKQLNGTGNDNCAWQDIFVTSSAETTPANAGGNQDVWVWASCNPTCGKDAGGNWQAPQEVVPTGAGTKLETNPFPRFVCSAAAGGNGDLSTSQSNSNTANPPGYMSE